ncbi:hypothetical protein [Inquilinus limosus]|uniref:Uncharacterized protein n=1 Tax=Inquilinus limosus MP06 TaxID=1398085 RepID=A0A0A0D1P2_9PROT|nr:hypothetical protein [Inquilinus limosus]KGM31959.1 hypothetical protein P409_24190 [Inquilinus limosus MP06]
MSFAGNSVKTPIMAAAHGMKQVAFNTIGDKVIRPLVEFAPPQVTQFAVGAAQQALQTAAGSAGSMASAVAGAMSAAAGSSGSSPIAALPELTGATPFVPPDFREMPQVDSASILDRARGKVRGVLSGLPVGMQDAVINAAETAITDGVAKTAGRKLGSDWSDRAKTLMGATGLGSGVDGAKKAMDGVKKAADDAVAALPGSSGAMKDAVRKVVADKAQQELARKVGDGWAKAARTVYDGSAKKPDIADARTPPFVPDPAKKP